MSPLSVVFPFHFLSLFSLYFVYFPVLPFVMSYLSSRPPFLPFGKDSPCFSFYCYLSFLRPLLSPLSLFPIVYCLHRVFSYLSCILSLLPPIIFHSLQYVSQELYRCLSGHDILLFNVYFTISAPSLFQEPKMSLFILLG